MDEEKIDVIHVHLRFGRYLKALSDSTLKRVRLIYTLHNEPGKYFDPQGSGKRLFEYKEAKRLIDKYDLTIVTLHDRMHDEVRELFGTDRVVTINNGINFERFDRGLYDRTKVSASLGIAEDIRVIGHVGSYTTQKNHEHILRVFREYLKTVPNAKLMLVGKGVLKDEIGRQIEAMGMGDHVISLENRSDVPALMSVMDVFILPSRWEGFPVVLIEAQKMGLPCVISDRIDKDVVLSDDVIMVDIDAEADKWVDALNGQGKREKIRGEFKDYDIRRSINELEKLYLGN